MKKWLVIIQLLFTVTLYAQGGINCIGPYCKRLLSDAGFFLKLDHQIGNFTSGIVQTSIGALHIPVYFLADIVRLQKPNIPLKIYKSPKGENDQIILNRNTPFGSGLCYSLGAFQVCKIPQVFDHEAGHSVASNSLGIFYLPAVIASYLTEGHSKSFLEEWADLSAYSAVHTPFSKTYSMGIGRLYDLKNSNYYASLYFGINKSQENKSPRILERKEYKLLDSIVHLPLDNTCGMSRMIASITPLSKETQLTVGFNSKTRKRSTVEFFNKSLSEYLTFDYDGSNQTFRSYPLKWSNLIGAQYSPSENFRVRLLGGPTFGAGVYAPERYSLGDDLHFDIFAGYNVQGEIVLFDYLSIKTALEQTWGVNGSNELNFFSGLSNDMKSMTKDRGEFLNYLELRGGYNYNEFNLGEEKISTENIGITLGGKF